MTMKLKLVYFKPKMPFNYSFLILPQDSLGVFCADRLKCETIPDTYTKHENLTDDYDNGFHKNGTEFDYFCPSMSNETCILGIFHLNM